MYKNIFRMNDDPILCVVSQFIAKKTKKRTRSKLLIKKKVSKRVVIVSEIEMLCFYDVDVVQKKRMDIYGEFEYFVSWKGYSSDNDSWIKNSWSIENTNDIPDTKDLYMLATMACNEI